MDVIINSDCNFIIPEKFKPLISQGNAILNFLVSLGYNPAYLPIADLLRRYHHLEGDWLIVSPIHWQATHNNAMISARGNELQLSETESKRWFQLFSEYLTIDGIELYYHDAETWLLCASNKPALHARSVYQIINQPLMHELAQLDSTMYWQKFFTESQMFFASHDNQSFLNGVWLWGGRHLLDKKMKSVCVDEELIEIAQQCSSNVTVYDSSISLKGFDILLLNNLKILSKSHKEQLKKIPTHWYWNNSAYYTRSDRNWFTRFWRFLTHAY